MDKLNNNSRITEIHLEDLRGDDVRGMLFYL